MLVRFGKGRNITQTHLQSWVFFNLGGFSAKLDNILFLCVQPVRKLSLPVEVFLEIVPISAVI